MPTNLYDQLSNCPRELLSIDSFVITMTEEARPGAVKGKSHKCQMKAKSKSRYNELKRVIYY